MLIKEDQLELITKPIQTAKVNTENSLQNFQLNEKKKKS